MLANPTTFAVLVLLVCLSGCTQTNGPDTVEGDTGPEAASQDIPASSPMAKISVGMSDSEARSILGRPDRIDSYQTGKSWIPYAGRWLNDKTRQSWYYHEMGYLILSRNSYSGQYVVREFVYDPRIRAY